MKGDAPVGFTLRMEGRVRSQIQKLSLFLSKYQRTKILKTITLFVSCECETWSLRLKIFGKEVGLVVHIRKWKRDGGRGEWRRKQYNEKCHTFRSSKNILLRHQMKQNALDKSYNAKRNEIFIRHTSRQNRR